MKPAPKIISRRVRKTRLKKFSKHWLDAVKLSDLSVLAASDGSSASGGEIYYQVPGAFTGVGAYVSPWCTPDPAANPPVFSSSQSYIQLVWGNHYGQISITNLGGDYGSGGSWQIAAMLDGMTLCCEPYDYTGGNQSYLEIDIDNSGNWTFWGDFGSCGGNPGYLFGYEGYARFGSAAGPGDYLMYNSFTNCSVNNGGWEAALSGATLYCNPPFEYQAVDVGDDMVVFEDNPPY
jgi:hypothetical protein